MKGPYERLKYDLRRVWECPVCTHRERSLGSETTKLCRCQTSLPPTKQVWMRLVEDGPRQVLKNGAIEVTVKGEVSAPAVLSGGEEQAPQIIQ